MAKLSSYKAGTESIFHSINDVVLHVYLWCSHCLAHATKCAVPPERARQTQTDRRTDGQTDRHVPTVRIMGKHTQVHAQILGLLVQAAQYRRAFKTSMRSSSHTHFDLHQCKMMSESLECCLFPLWGGICLNNRGVAGSIKTSVVPFSSCTRSSRSPVAYVDSRESH